MRFPGKATAFGAKGGQARPRDAALLLAAVVILLVFCLGCLIVRLAGNVEILAEVNKSTAVSETLVSDDLDDKGSETTDLDGITAINPTLGVAVKKDCPLMVPESISSLSYQEGNLCESWKGYSQQSCSSVARELLLALEASGAQLAHSGYLDLSGEAWGCSAKGEQSESLTVTLIPQLLGTVRNEGNQLCLTIVHIKAPDLGSDFAKHQGSAAASLDEKQ